MTAAATLPGFFAVFGSALTRRPRAAKPASRAPEAEGGDDSRARREFILGVMDDCPEAFASEDGVRQTMYYFSGRF